MTEEESLAEALAEAESIARSDHDGHLTVMRFTSGWKAFFGTPVLLYMGEYDLIFELDHHETIAGALEHCSPGWSLEDIEVREAQMVAKQEAWYAREMEIISALAEKRGLCESPIETALFDAMDHKTQRLVVPQYPVNGYRLDFAFPDAKLAVECDGHRWHSNSQAQAKDAKRDRELAADGWLVLRFAGTEIHNDVAAVVAEIKRHLAERAQ